MLFSDTTQALLHGTLSTRAQGFLIAFPTGATGRAGMARALDTAYGGMAHPDVFVLEGEQGGSAKIDDVRRALTFAHTHPAGHGLKTLWVPQADAMTPQAANAFLKTLEEPSPSTRVILGASRLERLLPTTRSRCMALSVRGDDSLALEELALAAPDSTPADRTSALTLTNGAIDAAARLLSAKGGLAWAKAAAAALRARTLMPIPTTGAQGIDAPTAGLVVQTALAQINHTATAETVAQIAAAFPLLHDLDRPGLDVSTRLRAIARVLHTA